MKILLFIIFATIFFARPSNTMAAERFFEVQAIDTMKTSRDKARGGVTDKEIEAQMQSIADIGATHVAIGTPYEDEFIPYMTRWVKMARKYNLKVWFRGNLAGWEGWFDYPRISTDQHKEQVRDFIMENPDLFEDGDIFVSCPECENGGPGDPRQTGDVDGFKKFILEEYYLSQRAFKRIGKNVITNYYSMNGDVARLIMDRKMTAQLGGIVTIDHYVLTPEELLTDVDGYAQQGEGKIILGEWGAPIPDIHGEMTEGEQAIWLEDSLSKIILNKNIIGVNYWTFTDSSTQLWRQDGTAKQGVAVLKKYFKPVLVRGTVQDEKGQPIDNAIIESSSKMVNSDNGSFTIPLAGTDVIKINKSRYEPQEIRVQSGDTQEIPLVVTLIRKDLSVWELIVEFFNGLFR